MPRNSKPTRKGKMSSGNFSQSTRCGRGYPRQFPNTHNRIIGSPTDSPSTPSANQSRSYTGQYGHQGSPTSPSYASIFRFISMPFPMRNGLFDVNGKVPHTVQEKWELLQSLSNIPKMKLPMTMAMETLIKKHTSGFGANIKFDLLHETVGQLPRGLVQRFDRFFHGMITLAQQLPFVLQKPVMPLAAGQNASIVLTKREIACLLANAFFCTFPFRDFINNPNYPRYPNVNFVSLFRKRDGRADKANAEKLKCLFEYFEKANDFLTSQRGLEEVKFQRVCLDSKAIPKWDSSHTPMEKIYVVDPNEKLEEATGLQVDFANKKIGGGVIGRGCVQEEIRFITCPELIVARLFTEELQENEALIVQGFEQFSSYEGYQETFKHTGPFSDPNYHRRTMIAIDATDYTRAPDKRQKKPFYKSLIPFGSSNDQDNGLYQYEKEAIDRELNKAYAGFKCDSFAPEAHIATGNWGGGCFKGDPVLKAKIQHLAASQAGRNLLYYPFHDNNLKNMVESNVTKQVMVSNAYNELLKWANEKKKHLEENLKRTQKSRF
ncbi:poly(ADP-ribose) glycohydrolase-like [Neocloeon triangulifer]|uniref:poly(ADP-ribose) glycohydrolase-like n=1 Tax=Neocloeon triangulifer TaxID=2078957 RepID=UPI00286F19DA|nr:poly(ADP-ribose) glycohydrolase-like [Neocloeon triangulifer]